MSQIDLNNNNLKNGDRAVQRKELHSVEVGVEGNGSNCITHCSNKTATKLMMHSKINIVPVIIQDQTFFMQ